MAIEQEKGLWSLRSPSNKEYAGHSPLQCIIAERDSRISKEEQVQNLLKALNQCTLCEEQFDGDTFHPGDGTPAWLGEICLTCARTIFEDLKQCFRE